MQSGFRSSTFNVSVMLSSCFFYFFSLRKAAYYMIYKSECASIDKLSTLGKDFNIPGLVLR